MNQMSVWEWLTTASSWQGEDGITHRLWEHVWLSAASVLVACLIALPVGIVLGHFGRGGVAAINLANAGRAVPTLGILILFAVSPLGLTTTTLIATLGLSRKVSAKLSLISSCPFNSVPSS